jgi:hypothetical protein
MALSYGQKWAIYLLLGEHSGTGATKSEFAAKVDTLKSGGLSLHDAVVKAAQQDVSTGITSADFAEPLKTLGAQDLRKSLALNASSPGVKGLYIPNGTTCPPSDAQAKIVSALNTMQPPQ